jgi:hypothetical protein
MAAAWFARNRSGVSAAVLGGCVISAMLTYDSHGGEWARMNREAEQGGWYLADWGKWRDNRAAGSTTAATQQQAAPQQHP